MLYIVATPIGNLEDITLRALRVLKEADIIAAEDTRHTRKLLSFYSIKTRLISFHEHSHKEKLDQIIDMLKQGQNVALVSDAGTPLISDPGAALVTEAAALGLPVTALPGACAAIAAFSLSGLGSPFCFVGFFSKKTSERRRQIKAATQNQMPSIIYESPHALKETLFALKETAGPTRNVIVAKELTKIHEYVFRGSLAQACDAFSENLKGEYVLIVSGCEKKPDEVTDAQIREAVNVYIAGGMTKKDAARAASDKLGVGKNRAYRLVL